LTPLCWGIAVPDEVVEGASGHTTGRMSGRIEIENNIAERSLRGIAVGRRNRLFAGSRVGGERAAAICTVIETCKMNGVEPQAYFADVIAKIVNDWPATRWDELMPWNWRLAADKPLAQAAKLRSSDHAY
jgi:transposase